MHHHLHPASGIWSKDKSSETRGENFIVFFLVKEYPTTTSFGLGIGSKQKTIAPCIVRGGAASKHIVWYLPTLFWIIIDKLIDLGPLNLLDFVFYSIEAKAKNTKYKTPQSNSHSTKSTPQYKIQPTITKHRFSITNYTYECTERTMF